MTERKGGSDVAWGTQTTAYVPSAPLLPSSLKMGTFLRSADCDANFLFHLFGYKWFTSATDADISVTLARIADTKGNVTEVRMMVVMMVMMRRMRRMMMVENGVVEGFGWLVVLPVASEE